MALTEVKPLKTLIEWQYKPQIAFQGMMDHFGTCLGDSFEDWQRAPHFLQLECKKSHRRVYVSFNRGFFESDTWEDGEGTLNFAVEVHDRFREVLSVEKYIRLGVRFLFALAFTNHDFARICYTLQKRLFVSNDKVSKLLGGGARVSDLACAVVLEPEHGWKAHLQLGPMRRDEWFQKISYERRLFEPKSFEVFQRGLPDAFICVDFDYAHEKIASTKFAEVVQNGYAQAVSTTKTLIDYYTNG